MGMYDEITVPIIRLPLDSSELNLFKEGHRFQTKSLECFLDEYTITADGFLIINRCRPASEPEQIEVLANFTDSFNFYSDIKGKWFEFTAYFENGKLKKIDRDRDAEKFYDRLTEIAK